VTTALQALARTILLARDFIPAELNVSDQLILQHLRATKVCIVADLPNLSTRSGQAAFSLLAYLVLAQGHQLQLHCPEVPLIGLQPPVRGDALRRGILELATDLIPDGSARVVDSRDQADLIFAFGDSAVEASHGVTLRLTGDEWSGAMLPAEEGAMRLVVDFPLGALASACIAAVEPFKVALRRLLGIAAPGQSYRELEAVSRASLTLGTGAVGDSLIDLGQIDFVSGGAITNAALNALLRVSGLRGHGRVIEPELLDASNLNRYSLARLSNLENPKTQVLAGWATPGFSLEQLPFRLDERTMSQVAPFAKTVVVGVDDIPTRWLVQEQWPDWLCVGSTSHFLTLTSEHEQDDACAGCLHPTDDGVQATIPTVSFVSYLAGLQCAARVLRRALGHARPREQQAIALFPLRLDGEHSLWAYAVPPNRACPVRCPASLRSEACATLPAP